MHSTASFFSQAVVLLLSAPLAAATGKSCTFAISSSGGFSCPAGQLDDGQIRLNGTEPISEFTIKDGKITDAAGRGCIVTEPPTTQVQCDLNKAPMGGFALDSDSVISYKGSSQFYACPATDTTYNIYVSPDFGQTKCFSIGLKASDCGTGSETCTPLPPSTVFQTSTVSLTIVKTSTVTQIITSSCTTPDVVTSTSTKPPCYKCTQGGNSTRIW